MAHQTAVDIIRVISEAVNPTGQFAYLRTWDASLEFNEVDQKIFLYPISGQVDITNGYFETWTCSMGFFFQDAPDSTNEQREQLITNADVLLKAFILAADTVDGVQFSIVRKRPVYRDMAGTYSGYLVDFTLSLTEDICNGDTPSVIIPVGKTFCELVDECLGISEAGSAIKFLNEQGNWVTVQGGGVTSVNGKVGDVVLDANDISETSTRLWLTAVLKSAYDGAVSWIATNGSNLINHLTNTSNPHSTTAAQVGAPSGSGTSTGTNTGDQDLSPYALITSLANYVTNSALATTLSSYATQAWVTSQGYITNVITALGFTPENVANKSDSYTATSSTTYASTKALVDGLASVNIFNITDNNDYIVTGTGAETIAVSKLIPANTLTADKSLFIRFRFLKSGAAGTSTIRLRFSHTPTPSPVNTATQFALGVVMNLTGSYNQMYRTVVRKSATTIEVYNPTLQSSVDDGAGATSTSTLTFDTTVDQWIHFTVQLGNGTDVGRISHLSIELI